MEEKTFNSAQEVSEALVKRAQEGKHTPFELLGSYGEFKVALNLYNAVVKVRKGFDRAVKRAFKGYLTLLKRNQDNLDLIISVNKLESYSDFYNEEAIILDDMINEYYAYLFKGHFFRQTLFGAKRPKKHLHDYRK